MYWEAAKLLIPPILAALLSGYLVNRFKSREDAVEKRLDELYAEIKLAADDATIYWQTEPAADDIVLKSARTLAALARLDGLRSAIASHLSVSASKEMAAAGSEFMREATGGDFGVHNRNPDILRAARIQQQASAYAVAVRKARMEDLKGLRRRS
ncbi:hypothetical protein [Bosea sp. (in: a-proteobacteria)]|uniref:hypothetical protein n=1 Tax=Bosea sp. (in: a-proteobacteria) TaxID=1871050 RepID=UPI001ACCCF10|nr:hypothetical protein [Bosea sp. (in: a-proteobacteria)]MBN9440349.1 hypothetical protein [Bosea sp. (in: a-proteobacteria)]